MTRLNNKSSANTEGAEKVRYLILEYLEKMSENDREAEELARELVRHQLVETTLRAEFYVAVPTMDGEKITVSESMPGDDEPACLIQITHGDAPMSVAYLNDDQVLQLARELLNFIAVR